LEGGEAGASPTLQSLIRGLQMSDQHKFRVEIIRPTESFPKSTARTFVIVVVVAAKSVLFISEM
jgi:hypothetical protein